MRRIPPLFSILLFVITFSALAQDGVCPIRVEEILTAAGDACGGLGRNEACYGNTNVSATWRVDDAPDFSQLGDIADITDMQTLITSPLNDESGDWGVALLSLAANLPDTLAGQFVRFVIYGDVELMNEVEPELVSAPILSAAATDIANVRRGPGTNFAVVGGLQAGDEISVLGRNSAGDWLQFNADGETAWVFAELVMVDGDIDSLRVAEAGADRSLYRAPMQAFRLSTGIGDITCEDVPRDGVLVQAPQNTTVNFLINGVEVNVGSTGLLMVDDDGFLTVNTLAGTIEISSEGESQMVEPGFSASASADEPPSEPEPYDYEAVRRAPVELLPDPVNIPVVVMGTAVWPDSGIMVEAGQTFTITATGAVNPCVNLTLDVCVPYPPEGGLGTPNELDPGHLLTYPVPDGMLASLVGRIGDEGEAFMIGAGGSFTVDSDGMLQFMINDWPPENNAGAFVVIVDIED
jgi:hypothetical protein